MGARSGSGEAGFSRALGRAGWQRRNYCKKQEGQVRARRLGRLPPVGPPAAAATGGTPGAVTQAPRCSPHGSWRSAQGRAAGRLPLRPGSVSPSVPGHLGATLCAPRSPGPGAPHCGRTYGVALAVGGRVGLYAIVKRGVNPAPLIGGLQGGRTCRKGGVRRRVAEAAGRKEETEIKEEDPNTGREGAARPLPPSPWQDLPQPGLLAGWGLGAGPGLRKGRWAAGSES